jgi:Protein of unknown function (DUF3040)
MSLSRRERRALRTIEVGISQSDPGLAGLLGSFNGLAAGSDMFAAERGRRPTALALSAGRLVLRGTAAAAAAVCAPGVRERLGVRGGSQPMARSTWRGLT